MSTSSMPLAYKVVRASSFDERHLPEHLEDPKQFPKGWMAAPKCSFPQELDLDFGRTVHIKTIRILSHEYKIPTRVEFYTKESPLPSEKWKKVG